MKPVLQRDLDTLRNRKRQLLNDQQHWRSQWADLADQFAPHRGRNLRGDGKPHTQEGKNPFRQILDTTGIDSIRTAAAGLNSGLTPRARPWFTLDLADPFMRRDVLARRYLDDRTTAHNSYLQRTNTYQVLHSTYTELLQFGTAAFAIDTNTDDGRPWRCVPFTAGEYCLDANADGVIDTFYRVVSMTTKQLVDRWAKKDGKVDVSGLPIQIRTAWETGRLNQRWEIDHIIEPNDDRMDLKDAAGRAFRSVWMLAKSQDVDAVLGVGGFDYFPIIACRWDVASQQVYGTGPGATALGPSLCLQRMAKDGLKALAKMVDPATQGSMREVNQNPGAHNTVMPGAGAIQPISEVRPDLGALLAYQQDKRNQVEELLFKHLFLMLSQMDQRQMTAFEVAERNAERLQILGPVLDRLEGEILEPLIRITGMILDDLGLMPLPPEHMGGQQMVIVYTSVLAQAQELLGVRGIREWAGWADALSARRPELDDKIDWDEVIDDLGHRYAVPARFLRDPQVVEQIRAQRAQQMAQQAQMEQANMQAQTGKTLAETPLGDGSSALNAVLGLASEGAAA